MRIYDLNKVIGNSSTLSLIRKSLEKNAFPSFTLMHGESGTGKSTVAEIVGLSLTCENPTNGIACLECRNCKQNIAALDAGKSSKFIKKKNIGALDTKKDFSEVMREVFDLQVGAYNVVYIFEEVHALDKSGQTALLEELKKQDSNVKIIFCTTKKYELLDELSDRAYPLIFKRLKDNEMKVVLDNLCSELGYNIADSKIESLLLQYAQGRPRRLSLQLETISTIEPTLEELQDSLSVIDNMVIVNFLVDLTDTSQNAIYSIERILEKYDESDLLRTLRVFLVNTLLFLNGSTNTPFNLKEKKRLKDTITVSHVSKMLNYMENYHLNTKVDSAELTLLFIKFRQVLKDKGVEDIVSDNLAESSRATVEANAKYVENEKYNLNKLSNLANANTEITKESFEDYFNAD